MGNIRCAASIQNDQMLTAINGEGQNEGKNDLMWVR